MQLKMCLELAYNTVKVVFELAHCAVKVVFETTCAWS